jgi:hypothetical protein
MDDLARLLRLATVRSPLVTTVAGGLHSCDSGTHTRLPDGRQLCWDPGDLLAGTACAVDAEIVSGPLPRAVVASARRRGRAGPATQAAGRHADVMPTADGASERLWGLWTRAEVRAKLRDVPILAWIDVVDWAADEDASPSLLRRLRVGVSTRSVEPEAEVEILTRRLGEVVVTYGMARIARRPDDQV